MTPTPIHAFVGRAGTTLRSCGAPQCVLGVVGFNATTTPGSSYAITIHRATTSDNVLMG